MTQPLKAARLKLVAFLIGFFGVIALFQGLSPVWRALVVVGIPTVTGGAVWAWIRWRSRDEDEPDHGESNPSSTAKLFGILLSTGRGKLVVLIVLGLNIWALRVIWLGMVVAWHQSPLPTTAAILLLIVLSAYLVALWREWPVSDTFGRMRARSSNIWGGSVADRLRGRSSVPKSYGDQLTNELMTLRRAEYDARMTEAYLSNQRTEE